MFSKSKILLIYTGGTIGMMKDFDTEALKAFNFSELLQKIPELKQLDCDIETVSFENPIDSSNIPMNGLRLPKILKIIMKVLMDLLCFTVPIPCRIQPRH
jgi:L-asparaginase